MLRNYLVTALRNLVRHKLYSLINIGGLAVGLTCVIFVLLFARSELSYDKWVPGTQNLYRIEKTYHALGRNPLALAFVPFPMLPAMRDEIPEVTAMTRLNYATMTLMAGDRQFRQRVAAVDPNFFTVIRLPLAKGDPTSVFRDPESLVLSESAARKYFGSTDVIGKIITTTANCATTDTQCLGRVVPLKITGVMRNIPDNSQLDGDVFLPNTSITALIDQRRKNDWFYSSGYGYAVLAPGAKPQTIISKTAAILDRAVTGELHSSGINLTGSQAYTIHLTPFTDVHLTSDHWGYNETPGGSWTTLYGVCIVGLLILFVAGFNFTNLATARGILRAREIALRKIHGATRVHLIIQFLGEAVLTALLSLVLALAMAEILEPAFGQLLQHPITLNYSSDWSLMLAVASIAIVAGLASGSYPALVLSGFRPATVLRASNPGQAGSGRLRTALVVLQFAVSIALGIAAAVVFAQISFARNIDLGFRKDNMLVVIGNGLLTIGGRESFTQHLRSNPDVSDVAMIDAPPFNRSFSLISVHRPGHSEEISLYQRVIDTNAIQLLGVKLVAGRLLSGKRAQDQINTSDIAKEEPENDGRNILIDEAAAAALGATPQQVVGQIIIWGKSRVRIVGVLANVKFDGAREPAKPAIYAYDPNYPSYAMIRIHPGAVPQTLAFIDRAWRDFAPTKAVWRYFLDDDFSNLYRTDEREGKMFGVFVLVAIFISCLGLFGLATFAADRRTREIGVRKVFGARTADIVWLLLWQFSIPVLLGNVIAWPITYYYLHQWLATYAYRISLSPLYFAGAGAVTLLIAWATVFLHTLHVARANPIAALRHE